MATSPLPPPYTPKVACLNCGMWGRVLGRNQSCQILTRSVQGFRSPSWPKIAISHWLEVSPLQQCTHSAELIVQTIFTFAGKLLQTTSAATTSAANVIYRHIFSNVSLVANEISEQWVYGGICNLSIDKHFFSGRATYGRYVRHTGIFKHLLHRVILSALWKRSPTGPYSIIMIDATCECVGWRKRLNGRLGAAGVGIFAR